ncbi:serine/threonine-protein kinase [Streptomyces sp. NPDC018610]|uniref:serine/threonine-protein kinase n=1 Tax=Streptomyces sp. NPDC018610 TaxID=3365049 RepID=UPI0037A41BD8
MQPLAQDEPAAVGPYRLLGRLGSGGMGRVYLGRSAGGRTVAVKIVHPHFALDEEFRARFRREVAAARRVGGAWTAPVLDADPEAPVPWVATAYAAGPSLAAAVADAGPLPAHSVRVLAAGLAEALAAVHRLGLVHRDVKPSNVLLTLDGPLLIDFGIARATDGTASLTSTGVSIGSPGYMSPEQILGKGVTGAADVFSLGAVLAYGATGRPPFAGDSSAALLYKVVHEEPELDALGDGELGRLARECLAKDPAARPAPGEIARRLAPGGTASLVAGGWLPGRLVEQVSRGAVSLLNLEAAEPGASGDPVSGPLGFGTPSVTPTGAAGGSASAPRSPESRGEFGPPPEMPAAPPYFPGQRNAPDASAVPDAPGPSGTPGGPGASGDPDAPGGPGTSGGPGAFGGSKGDSGAGPGTGPGTGSGRFSVTVAAGSTPGSGGRGRRMSCSVVLAVAGALAVATTLGVVLLKPFDHGSGGGDASGARPSAAATAGAVPTRFLGTWRGDGTVTAVGEDFPGGTFEVVVRQAAPGGVVGSVTQTDGAGGTCVDVLTLKSATDEQLVATGRGSADNPSHCVPDAHVVHLRPDAGDALDFTSEDPKAGNPKATLEKVD